MPGNEIALEPGIGKSLIGVLKETILVIFTANIETGPFLMEWALSSNSLPYR